MAIPSTFYAMLAKFDFVEEPETNDPSDGRREFERFRGRLSVYPARIPA